MSEKLVHPVKKLVFCISSQFDGILVQLHGHIFLNRQLAASCSTGIFLKGSDMLDCAP